MAAENRTERRALAQALLGAMRRGRDSDRFTRAVVGGAGAGERAQYIFLSLKRPPDTTAEVYRQARARFLKVHCQVFRGQQPSAKHIIGIATEPLPEAESTDDWHGEDLAYLDGTNWSEAEQAEAERLSRDLNLLTNVRRHNFSVKEYPVETRVDYAKGRSRNLPCPCGSGKKAKRCCHRT